MGTAITDSAGIRLVTAGARGQWRDGQGWRPVQDLRIGQLEGASEYTFNSIAALALGPGDTLFVLDQGDKTITAYDPEGRFVRRFGGEGDGPGEYRDPRELVATDDGLLVYDWRPRRLTLLDWTGQVVRTAIVTQWTPFGSRLRMLNDTVFALGITGGQSAPPRPETDGRFWLVRFSTAGAILDTLIADAGGESVVHRTGTGVTVFSAPFARGPRWDLGPDGSVVYGRGDQYVIDLYRPDPWRLVASVRRTVPSLSATDADRAAYREPYERPSIPEATRKRYADILATVTYPGTWPAYVDLRFDAAGRLWVRRPAHSADSLIPWDVFDAEGAYLGDVMLPRSLQVRLIEERAVYGVMRDELDVPSVVRYRIERPGPGSP
jgi:hypothetical protein